MDGTTIEVEKKIIYYERGGGHLSSQANYTTKVVNFCCAEMRHTILKEDISFAVEETANIMRVFVDMEDGSCVHYDFINPRRCLWCGKPIIFRSVDSHRENSQVEAA